MPPHEPPGNFRYEPFGAVPPPPGLDPGKGRKGKGKGDDPEGHRGSPEGIVLSNVPKELNTLDVLNRHFRQFGEVLKITSQVAEGKAFLQFANRAAAEAALSVPVLDRPDIAVAWSLRPKGKGGSKGGKSSDGPAENRVLCTDPEEQRKVNELKTKREELASRKTALLANLTSQMKVIMAKLHDPNVSEAKRETLRTLLLGLKEKLDSLGVPGSAGRAQAQAQIAARSNRLDHRTRILKFHLTEGGSLEELREELRKLGAPDDQVVDLHLEPSEDGLGSGTAVVQFRERSTADKIFSLRSEIAASVEWLEPVPAHEESARDAAADLLAEGMPPAQAEDSVAAPEQAAEILAAAAAEPVEESEPAPAAETEAGLQEDKEEAPVTAAEPDPPLSAMEAAAEEPLASLAAEAAEKAEPPALPAQDPEEPPAAAPAATSFEETAVDFGGGAD